jgi:hypothetical protein
MKGLKIFIAAVAVIGLAAGGAFAGANCGAKHADTQQTSATCAAKGATAQAADAKAGCGSAAMSAGAGCGSKAAAAGAGCGSAAMAASGCCAGGAKSASAGCMTSAGACDLTKCGMSNIEYRVSVDGHDMKTFDREKAFAFAQASNVPVRFYVKETAYQNEAEANMALLTTMRERMNELLTLQYVVDGQAMKCSKTASEMASACQDKKMAYRVASREFASQQEAESYLHKLQAAVAAVKVVDSNGKPVDGCAASHAKQCGDKKVSFKVGDQVAADPMDANLLRTREQLRIILTAQV